MSILKGRVRAFILGAFFSLGFSLPFVIDWEEKPYGDVVLEGVRREGRDIFIDVSFTKFDCTFERLAATGIYLGGIDYNLPTSDLDGDQGDRLAGKHWLNLKVTMKKEYDTVDVTTRHLCEDEIVDKVLVSVEVPNEDL